MAASYVNKFSPPRKTTPGERAHTMLIKECETSESEWEREALFHVINFIEAGLANYEFHFSWCSSAAIWGVVMFWYILDSHSFFPASERKWGKRIMIYASRWWHCKTRARRGARCSHNSSYDERFVRHGASIYHPMVGERETRAIFSAYLRARINPGMRSGAISVNLY